ncbi:hypothetical protein [Streptomyces nitrosporeus]|nr:hypothetical protein [Streptomyces nitrosporeus]GGZ29538.1 hypothetical protein GCM10010327_69790 [Streptomyces nitrosporeus]
MGFMSRLTQGSDQVYARIESGACADVEAELMDAHLKASVPDDENE